MYRDSAEVMTAAEADEGQGVQKILKDTAEFVEVGHTGSEAATIVRNVTGLDAVKAWRRLQASDS